MSIKSQKVITAVINAIAVIGSFQALINILNLNQPVIYLKTAAFFTVFLFLEVVLLYDLHFKIRGSWHRAKARHESVEHWLEKRIKVIFSSLAERLRHLSDWKFIHTWMNYLLLPGLIFWSTIAIFYVNFGFIKIQQIFMALSSLAIILNYWYLKEIFLRGKEKVDQDVFVVLSVVKIYAGTVVFTACLALTRHYCLEPYLLFWAVVPLTFLLIYQALFQHRMINAKNLFISLCIALVMGGLAYVTLFFWSYNYFTAAVFLAACYNLMWGVFHYKLDHALTWHSFFEILIICLLVAGMIFSVTNFRAQILDGCNYQFNRPLI